MAPAVADPDRIGRFVDAVAANPDSRLLDVACGPGFLALAFARRCRETVGIDLTQAPLNIARRNCDRDVLKNVSFLSANADCLPFADETFDVVVSRLALHHVEDAGNVLREMARVCRPEGTVAVEDLVCSEHAARAQVQNQIEQLRDPSHTRALAPSELLGKLAATGLETQRLYSAEVVQNLERWLTNSQTPPSNAAQVRKMIETDAREDMSGMRPYINDEEWVFRHHMLTAVARTL